MGGWEDTLGGVDAGVDGRAIVLCSWGRDFCAGADLPGALRGDEQSVAGSTGSLYEEAARLFAARTPIVAAVQGAAGGGGPRVALGAGFRGAGPSPPLVADLSPPRLHHGFRVPRHPPAAVRAAPA